MGIESTDDCSSGDTQPLASKPGIPLSQSDSGGPSTTAVGPRWSRATWDDDPNGDRTGATLRRIGVFEIIQFHCPISSSHRRDPRRPNR